jgi:hypothetical protein
MAGSCEHGNECSGSIKGSEFLEYPSDCKLFKKDSAPSSQLSAGKASRKTCSCLFR